MRKKINYQVWVGIAVIVLVAIFSYFGVRLHRQDKQLNELSVTVVDNSTQVNYLVSFINQSLANMQTDVQE